MDFKDMIASDIGAVFLNPQEFGEEHEVNGEKVMILLDDNALEEHNIASLDKQSAKSDILFYIDSKFFGPHIPRASKQMKFNGRNYRIDDVKEDVGILSIKLSRPEE